MAESEYKGAGWIEQQIPYGRGWKGPMSDFGRNVANLLGEFVYGIYHINPTYLIKADWSHSAFIEINYDQTLATFDFDNLTRFVFLCHDYGMRGQISARSSRTLLLMFHPRERGGDITRRHPTLEQALAKFRKSYPVNPEKSC